MDVNLPEYLKIPLEEAFKNVCRDNPPSDVSKVLGSFVSEYPYPSQKDINENILNLSVKAIANMRPVVSDADSKRAVANRYASQFSDWLRGKKGKDNCPPKDPPTGASPAGQRTDFATATPAGAKSTSYALKLLSHTNFIPHNVSSSPASSQPPWYRGLLLSMSHFLGVSSPVLIGAQSVKAVGPAPLLVPVR